MYTEDKEYNTVYQAQEDVRHYYNYEKQRLAFDREKIFEEYVRTTVAIAEKSHILLMPTQEEIEQNSAVYNKYREKCEKLYEMLFCLTPEQFAIKNKNPIHCASFKFWLYNPGSSYMIHDESTAKYLKGNMQALLASEFASKWY